MCVNISATVALFCLFAPKVYIVLLQPHKNVRQTSAASLAGKDKPSRTIYDSSAASTVGAQLYSYSDLNGGVYCGEIPTQAQLPLPSRERRNNSYLLPATTTALTTAIFAEENRNMMRRDEEEAIDEEMLSHLDSIDKTERDEVISFSKHPSSVNEFDGDSSSCDDELSPAEVMMTTDIT